VLSNLLKQAPWLHCTKQELPRELSTALSSAPLVECPTTTAPPLSYTESGTLSFTTHGSSYGAFGTLRSRWTRQSTFNLGDN